ncbi:MAG: hypothetical protein SGJ27_15115 [Candidatus Melainabacteria bacterium]|nr:hypothetical protein [Candidatus Melainabacteria bacterium]
MIFGKTSFFYSSRIDLLASAIVLLGLAQAAALATNEPPNNGTTDGANQILIAQTLELRDSGIPAKTLDDSGLKHLEDPLAAKPTQVLEGVLRKEELTGHVTLSDDKKSLTLYAVNHGKRALIFSGDQATVTAGSTPQRTLTRNEVVSPPAKTDIPKDIIQVAVSIVSDGAIPLIYDLKTEYRPDGTAYYGKDQVRRKAAERRFGQRTLFPGESTTGRVYLPEGLTAPSQLTIPIIVHPSGESVGNIVLPVVAQ